MNIFERLLHPSRKEKEEVVAVVEEEVKAPTPPTKEEVIAAKETIAELQEKRQALLEDLRNEKDALRDLGIKEFVDDTHPTKRTETFAGLLHTAEAELAEVSREIGELRDRYDLTPSVVEVLEARKKRVEDIIARIESKTAPVYRMLLQKWESFFGEHPERAGDETIGAFMGILKEHEALPEVQVFFDQLHSKNIYDNKDVFTEALLSLKEALAQGVEEHTEYKTPGALAQAYQEIERGVALHDEITRTLADARNNTGRFEVK